VLEGDRFEEEVGELLGEVGEGELLGEVRGEVRGDPLGEVRGEDPPGEVLESNLVEVRGGVKVLLQILVISNVKISRKHQCHLFGLAWPQGQHILLAQEGAFL